MANEDSIIEIIQKMVRDGEPRDRVLQTLRELGVNEEQAKRLLLIAEADTFTLLRKEINSLVSKEVSAQSKHLEAMIHDDVARAEAEEKGRITALAKEGLVGAEKDVIGKTREFEERINRIIGASQKTVNMVKIGIDSLQTRLSQLELDMEQVKVHRYRKGSKFLSTVMLVVGAGILILTIYMFIANFESLDSSQMMLIAVMALASIALMFASVIS